MASLLLIALGAMLAGCRDPLGEAGQGSDGAAVGIARRGIVRGGRQLSGETLRAIGIARDRVPAPSVWCDLFQDLDIAALEQALSGWVMGEAPVSGPVAIDGKRLRGSATGQAAARQRDGASGCAAARRGKRLRGSATAHTLGTPLLAAFSASLQGVIGQLQGVPEANEITAALDLLKILPLQGLTLTGDAIFPQKAICQTIIESGGHSFFTVKGNQPPLPFHLLRRRNLGQRRPL